MRTIGCGEFGCVYLAEAHDILRAGTVTEVAVKALKGTTIIPIRLFTYTDVALGILNFITFLAKKESILSFGNYFRQL